MGNRWQGNSLQEVAREKAKQHLGWRLALANAF
jgi:hypothetical protein